MQERDHELAEEIEERERQQKDRQTETDQLQMPSFLPIDARAEAADWILSDGDTYTQAELRSGRLLAAECGVRVPDIDMAKVWRHLVATGRLSSEVASASTTIDVGPELYTAKKDYAKNVQRRVARLSFLTNQEPRVIHARIYREVGAWSKQRTKEQWERALTVVEQWLRNVAEHEPVT
jgi:hypothetical protein